jgi:hypothetical protein
MVCMVLCQIGICFSGLNSALGGLDFRTFYSAGHMVRSGEAVQIYDIVSEKRVQDALVAPRQEALPFFNPAYAALPFVLLSLFGYKAAYFIFFSLNFMMAVFAAAVMRPYLAGIADVWQGLPTFLFLCFVPVGIALREGQLSLIMLLLCCTCFAASQTSRPFVAGLLLALALIKFQIALPMAVLFLAWRRWRFVAGFASGGVALAGISLWITGINGSGGFWHSIVSSSVSSSTTVAMSQMSRMANIYGFFYSISNGAHWGQVLAIVCSGLILLWGMFQRPSIPMALLIGILVSFHLYQYDLSLLLLPVSLAFNQAVVSFVSLPSGSPLSKKYILSSWPSAVAIFLCGLLLFPPVYVLLILTGRVYLLACPIAALLFCLPVIGDRREGLAEFQKELRQGPEELVTRVCNG